MDKIKELEEKIKSAQIAYYNDSSIIEDDEYDALIYELSCLDKDNDLLKVVGAEPAAEEWIKTKHPFPLGSLFKVNTPQELQEWITKDLHGKSVLWSEKIDGLSIGCIYEDGNLIKCPLRGNGFEGEDIFQNVLKMQGVVRYIPGFTGVLRGEIIVTKQNHKTYFPDKANPRNCASGVCRRLDGEGCEHLTVMFYQVLGGDFVTEQEQMQFLEKHKCIVPNYKLCKSSKEVDAVWQEYQDKTRDSLDWEIDGLVVAANDVSIQNELGETNLRPKGKRAFKFAKQFVKTIVKDITWSSGSMGRVTPICWVEPVSLLGSTVSKASIYNISYIKELGLDIGAEVLICKAGEIIPRIEKVIKSTGTIVKIPIHCQECKSILEMDGENLMCPNKLDCPAIIKGRIENWVNELNLLEWGESLIEHLVESKKATTIADLYKLSIADLASLERMGEKSATTCHRLLWEKSEVPLEIFLGGLSIPLIGQSSIKLIMAAGIDTLDKFLAAKIEHFMCVPGMGPGRSKSLFDGLNYNKELIKQLLENGVTIKEKVKIMGVLSGKTICFTGKAFHKRSVLEGWAIEAGAEVKNAVNKDLDILVIADAETSTSSKAVAARKFGIKLIDEEQFITMVGMNVQPFDK
jgi:DNA ligase (NAD+)